MKQWKPLKMNLMTETAQTQTAIKDNDISFMNDTDTAEIEEEDWTEYIKRSTDEAMQWMESAKIQCWMEAHRRMKWRLAMIIAS